MDQPPIRLVTAHYYDFTFPPTGVVRQITIFPHLGDTAEEREDGVWIFTLPRKRLVERVRPEYMILTEQVREVADPEEVQRRAKVAALGPRPPKESEVVRAARQ